MIDQQKNNRLLYHQNYHLLEKPVISFFFSFLFCLFVFSFIISWRLITLQYCSGFCHTLT